METPRPPSKNLGVTNPNPSGLTPMPSTKCGVRMHVSTHLNLIPHHLCTSPVSNTCDFCYDLSVHGSLGFQFNLHPLIRRTQTCRIPFGSDHVSIQDKTIKWRTSTYKTLT